MEIYKNHGSTLFLICSGQSHRLTLKDEKVQKVQLKPETAKKEVVKVLEASGASINRTSPWPERMMHKEEALADFKTGINKQLQLIPRMKT